VKEVDPDAWEPPDALAPHEGGVRGALGGSRLLDRPEHAAFRAGIEAFVAAPGPLILEIGFDHGMVLLESARLRPDVRWLGCEIRRARVEAAAAHAPPNALLLRADGRTLLASLIPPGRLEGVVVLFPSPSHDPRHLLLTPETVALIQLALAPEGRLHVATDVPGMARWAERLLQGWPEGDPLPLAPVLSRRERVCRRDGRPVWRFTRRAPPS
jgi:tRNA G46 methylase TrmB